MELETKLDTTKRVVPERAPDSGFPQRPVPNFWRKADFLPRLVANILVLALVALGLNFALAQWTGPSANPPSGNVAAPINTGSTTQTKSGALGLQSFLDIAQITAPANPGAGTRRLFVDSADGKLKVKTSAGASPSLEEQGATTIFIRKTADETVNNDTTLQDDDHFTFAIGASEVWEVELKIHVSQIHETADLQFTFTLPAGASMLAIGMMLPVANAGSLNSIRVGTTPGTGIFLDETLGQAQFLTIAAILRNGATAGTATLQWAQNTAGATNLTFALDSFMVAHLI